MAHFPSHHLAGSIPTPASNILKNYRRSIGLPSRLKGPERVRDAGFSPEPHGWFDATAKGTRSGGIIESDGHGMSYWRLNSHETARCVAWAGARDLRPASRCAVSSEVDLSAWRRCDNRKGSKTTAFPQRRLIDSETLLAAEPAKSLCRNPRRGRMRCRMRLAARICKWQCCRGPSMWVTSYEAV